jgi:hypothetical protein
VRPKNKPTVLNTADHQMWVLSLGSLQHCVMGGMEVEDGDGGDQAQCLELQQFGIPAH